jgi:hypothetical protein
MKVTKRMWFYYWWAWVSAALLIGFVAGVAIPR